MKYFSVFLLNCKIRHASTTWKELIRKHTVCPFSGISQKSRKQEEFIWGMLSQNYLRLYGHLTMFQESQLDPCSTLEQKTWSNNQSHYDLLYGGVSLSIV